MKTKLPRRAVLDKEDTFNELIQFLREMQVQRRYCIKSQSRTDRSLESFLARSLGYDTDLVEDDRKKLMLVAKKIRQQVERAILDGEEPDNNPQIPDSVFGMIRISFASRQHWDEQRSRVESRMVQAARLLPVWPWVKSVSGVAELGLAVLVGEAGDIGNYSGPGKLWVRFGLGTYNGHRQSFIPKEITGEDRKQEWIKRGYSPARRAEVWAFLDDVLFRSQWRGAKDDDGKNPAITKQPIAIAPHPIGPYGQVYGERKEWNIARGLPPSHADKDAKRFMAKRFIRDLWVQWQEAKVQQMAYAAE